MKVLDHFEIRLAIIIAVIALSVFLVSCTAEFDNQVITDDDYPLAVQDFLLDDGTRCIFAKTQYAGYSTTGGLSCDFESKQ